MSLQALKDELIAGHPTSGAYSVNNQAAANELNALNRVAVASVEALRNYFLLERKGNMALMGRLEYVSQQSVGAVNPLGDAVTLTLAHVTACQTMMRITNPGSDFALDLNDARFQSLLDDLAGGTGCKVIGPADKTAITAMSQNKQSRATELGFGLMREGHIEVARA